MARIGTVASIQQAQSLVAGLTNLTLQLDKTAVSTPGMSIGRKNLDRFRLDKVGGEWTGTAP